MQLGAVDKEALRKAENKRKRQNEEEKRKEKERERCEEEERGRKRAKQHLAEASEEDESGNEDADESYVPHVKTRPTHIQLEIPIQEYREEVSKIGNRRGLTNRGQCDMVSTTVLMGGEKLKNIACSTTTMGR